MNNLDSLLKPFKGKERSQFRRMYKTEIEGLRYYCEKLQDKNFLNILPSIVLSYKNIYGQ